MCKGYREADRLPGRLSIVRPAIHTEKNRSNLLMNRMQDCLKAGTICLNSFWGIFSSELGKHGVVEVRAPAGPGEMILQRGMIFRMVL